MSQTNTMAMGGGQITQNVVASNANSQQVLGPAGGPQGQMNMQQGGMGGAQQIGPGGQAPMMGQQQRPPFDEIEMLRQQNLLKIHQLRETLEAAQQQEAQYKSQIEVSVCTKNLSRAFYSQIQRFSSIAIEIVFFFRLFLPDTTKSRSGTTARNAVQTTVGGKYTIFYHFDLNL